MCKNKDLVIKVEDETELIEKKNKHNHELFFFLVFVFIYVRSNFLNDIKLQNKTEIK